eukprot:294031-Chlamydomonas_euryale.AAC.1
MERGWRCGRLRVGYSVGCGVGCSVGCRRRNAMRDVAGSAGRLMPEKRRVEQCGVWSAVLKCAGWDDAAACSLRYAAAAGTDADPECGPLATQFHAPCSSLHYAGWNYLSKPQPG